MSLSFQILNPGESTFEVKTVTEKLTHYVDTYEFETSTELIDPAKVRRPFLRSNLLIEEENSEDEENGEEEGEQEVEEGKETAGEGEHEKSMSTDGRSGAGDQAQKENKKKKKRTGRVVVVSSNKIRLSIDAKTYKLQFNNRRNTSHQTHHHHQQTNPPASSSSSRPTNLQTQLQDHEPTDLLVIKDFSLASDPADLGSITNLQNRKFLAWLTTRQLELNELNQAV
jgi:histone deacetylase complex regulatory component SIN3